MPYKILRADCVVETISNLHLRIVERFPDASLAGVAAELLETAERCAAEAKRLREPAMPIRLSVYGIWIFGAFAALWIAASLHYEGFDGEATTFVQFLEPAMNLAVLIGIGVLTLGRMEQGWKRARAFDYLHELRSFLHVVDMHQLTKDPNRPALRLADTLHSPRQRLHGALLERYFDYCSEMASLTGKLAALLAQSTRDTEVTVAASDIEQLANGLSRKIWQKIMVMDREYADPDLESLQGSTEAAPSDETPSVGA